MRYRYANGRPSRVEAAPVSNDWQTLNGYNTYYIQYNWHGDATNFVTSNGIGGSGATLYNPWGNGMNAGPSWNYYGWGGGWGYLGFPSLGLYYVHGRWYNPDIGRFISPDAKGDYRYGSGDDAINWAWLSAGLQCQFWNDITFGSYDNIPGAIVKCRENDGNVSFYYGQIIGRGLSNATGVGEIFVGGATFTGGGAITVGSGGTSTAVSVPAAVWGLAVGVQGAAILVHNLQNPPILYAKKSETNSDLPGSWGPRVPSGPKGAAYEEKVRQNFGNPKKSNLFVNNGERNVAFDAWDPKTQTLIDAKESDGASIYDKVFEPWAQQSILDEARDQLKAGQLKGKSVAWYVSNQSTAETLRRFFTQESMNIRIVFFP